MAEKDQIPSLYQQNMWSCSGMPRFPLSHRYAQLKPFDVTPDDVLSSQKQLCVNYIPPTLGAPCNHTTMRRPLARDENGFDRNGFDRNGKLAVLVDVDLK